MDPIINIYFDNVTTTANELLIQIEEAKFLITGAGGFGVSGALGYMLPTIGGINLAADIIEIFAPMQSNFNATVSVGVAPVMTPTIIVSGFEGSAQVTWWVEGGQQTQPLTSGVPLALEGFGG